MKYLLILCLFSPINFSASEYIPPEQVMDYLTILYEDKIGTLNNLKDQFLATGYKDVNYDGAYTSSDNIRHISGAEEFIEQMTILNIWKISRNELSISFFRYSGSYQQISSDIAISYYLKKPQNSDVSKTLQECEIELYYAPKFMDHCKQDIGSGWHLYHFWTSKNYAPKPSQEEVIQ